MNKSLIINGVGLVVVVLGAGILIKKVTEETVKKAVKIITEKEEFIDIVEVNE